MKRVSPNASPSRVEVLMYHSISGEPGPTSISPACFASQLRTLREHGFVDVALGSLSAWARGEAKLPPQAVVLTFDDGFADFSQHAFPLLREYGYGATVFLPTAHMGGMECWDGANASPRPLMSWRDVQALAREGIEFGGHSRTHADLTRLSSQELEREVRGSQEALAEQLGTPPRTFAPPYGRSNPRVLHEVARWSEVSVGTRLHHARPGDDVFDLPRLEMFYFRAQPVWDLYLRRRADAYLRARQLARRVRARLVRARRGPSHGK